MRGFRLTRSEEKIRKHEQHWGSLWEAFRRAQLMSEWAAFDDVSLLWGLLWEAFRRGSCLVTGMLWTTFHYFGELRWAAFR